MVQVLPHKIDRGTHSHLEHDALRSRRNVNFRGWLGLEKRPPVIRDCRKSAAPPGFASVCANRWSAGPVILPPSSLSSAPHSGRKGFLLFRGGCFEIAELAFLASPALQLDSQFRRPPRRGLDYVFHDAYLA